MSAGPRAELIEIRRLAAEAWRLAGSDEAVISACAECGRTQSEAADDAEDALYRRILGPDFDYDGDGTITVDPAGSGGSPQ